jgi:hypothetical protein
MSSRKKKILSGSVSVTDLTKPQEFKLVINKDNKASKNILSEYDSKFTNHFTATSGAGNFVPPKKRKYAPAF